MSHPARSTLEQPDYDGHFVMIPLDKGKFAIFDEADAEKVMNWMAPHSGEWVAGQAATNTWYADRYTYNPFKVHIRMHVLVAGFTGVDHVHRNGLDTRRINLRAATPSQNMANRPPFRNNKSGYKGVYWTQGRFTAAIKVNYRKICLGRFDDPVEAARAYNEAALEHFGEFAWLNPLPDAAEPPAA